MLSNKVTLLFLILLSNQNVFCNLTGFATILSIGAITEDQKLKKEIKNFKKSLSEGQKQALISFYKKNPKQALISFYKKNPMANTGQFAALSIGTSVLIGNTEEFLPDRCDQEFVWVATCFTAVPLSLLAVHSHMYNLQLFENAKKDGLHTLSSSQTVAIRRSNSGDFVPVDRQIGN